jgi:hypothetical protein
MAIFLLHIWPGAMRIEMTLGPEPVYLLLGMSLVLLKRLESFT